jgi:hypothetical protein
LFAHREGYSVGSFVGASVGGVIGGIIVGAVSMCVAITCVKYILHWESGVNCRRLPKVTKVNETKTEGLGPLKRKNMGLLGGRLGGVKDEDLEERGETIPEMDSGNTMVERVCAGNTSNDRGYVRTSVIEAGNEGNTSSISPKEGNGEVKE